MAAFFICTGIAFAIVLIREIMTPTSLVRGAQEGNYGGIIFFFAASSLTLGAVFWVIFSIIRLIF